MIHYKKQIVGTVSLGIVTTIIYLLIFIKQIKMSSAVILKKQITELGTALGLTGAELSNFVQEEF